MSVSGGSTRVGGGDREVAAELDEHEPCVSSRAMCASDRRLLRLVLSLPGERGEDCFSPPSSCGLGGPFGGGEMEMEIVDVDADAEVDAV